MALAPSCYYEKVHWTMCTAIASHPLNYIKSDLVYSINQFIIMVFSQEDFIRSEKVELKEKWSKVLSEANFLIQKTTCAD